MSLVAGWELHNGRAERNLWSRGDNENQQGPVGLERQKIWKPVHVGGSVSIKGKEGMEGQVEAICTREGASLAEF